MTEVFVLDEQQISHYWPKISECLNARPDLWDKWWTEEGLRLRALNGSICVWAVCAEEDINVVFFTQVIPYDTGNALQVFWGFGQGALPTQGTISAKLDAFGKHFACDRIEFVAMRRGWEKVLRTEGVEFSSMTFTRPIRLRKGH